MKEINICGIPHKIIYTEDVFDTSEKHFGLIDYEKCCIYINVNMPTALQVETIFHEYVHGVLIHIGEDEKSMDEKFVQTFSNALYRTFGGSLEKDIAGEEKPLKGEIVHCGECKHYGIVCHRITALPTEMDYCSWGERE